MNDVHTNTHHSGRSQTFVSFKCEFNFWESFRSFFCHHIYFVCSAFKWVCDILTNETGGKLTSFMKISSSSVSDFSALKHEKSQWSKYIQLRSFHVTIGKVDFMPSKFVFEQLPDSAICINYPRLSIEQIEKSLRIVLSIEHFKRDYKFLCISLEIRWWKSMSIKLLH